MNNVGIIKSIRRTLNVSNVLILNWIKKNVGKNMEYIIKYNNIDNKRKTIDILEIYKLYTCTKNKIKSKYERMETEEIKTLMLN